jgi:hypothetical protein
MNVLFGAGSGGSFRTEQHEFFQPSRHAPKTLNMRTVEAGREVGAKEAALWGCPVTNFTATLPIHGMREAFAAF